MQTLLCDYLSCEIHRASSILVQVLSCKLHGADSHCATIYCADSIVRIPLSCGFYRANSIMQILSCAPLCGFHRAESIMRIFSCAPSWNSIVRILLEGVYRAFHHADSIVRYVSCAPSCGFNRADSIVLGCGSTSAQVTQVTPRWI